MTIGDVLGLLRPEFPDITISKIRFLESEGLVEPERSPSGYRKFCDADVERLRFVLTAQRDHYLPLRVIRQRLEARDHGESAPAPAVRDSAACDSAVRAPERRRPPHPGRRRHHRRRPRRPPHPPPAPGRRRDRRGPPHPPGGVRPRPPRRRALRRRRAEHRPRRRRARRVRLRGPAPARRQGRRRPPGRPHRADGRAAAAPPRQRRPRAGRRDRAGDRRAVGPAARRAGQRRSTRKPRPLITRAAEDFPALAAPRGVRAWVYVGYMVRSGFDPLHVVIETARTSREPQ
ncbi:MerR family transcriptional regulator [Actinomadura madurae]|nr:MerR family transcriptional regulator [Actinomadura madurae]MCQ0012955.1 MerR family transcriptional regulator [Actinomadura madurae]